MKSILLAFALLFSLAFASHARADECAGPLTKRAYLYGDSGETIGVVSMHYNSNNGLNCATFRHAGWTWGRYFNSAVYLYDCTGGSCVLKSQAGNFTPYGAGPVRAFGRGRCIVARGGISLSSGSWQWKDLWSGGCY